MLNIYLSIKINSRIEFTTYRETFYTFIVYIALYSFLDVVVTSTLLLISNIQHWTSKRGVTEREWDWKEGANNVSFEASHQSAVIAIGFKTIRSHISVSPTGFLPYPTLGYCVYISPRGHPVRSSVYSTDRIVHVTSIFAPSRFIHSSNCRTSIFFLSFFVFTSHFPPL